MRAQRITVWRQVSPANDFRPDDPAIDAVAHPLATLKPNSGSETETADQQQGTTSYTIRMKWGPSLAAMDSSWWATWQEPVTKNDVRLNFESVANVDEANQWFEIQATRS